MMSNPWLKTILLTLLILLQPVFIGKSVVILSELQPSLITRNTNDYYVDLYRIHKREGKVASICFNCCTIMIKQHSYVV